MFDAVISNPRNRGTVGIGLLLLASGLTLNYLFERHSLFGVRDDLFYPVLCFVLLLTGLVVSIGGVAGGSMRRLLPYLFSIVVPLTVLYIGFYVGMQFIQTGADRLGECPGLDQAAANSRVIPKSQSRPGLPAIGCGVERRGLFLQFYNRLTIWGVTDPSEQQKVLDQVAEYYRRADTHPIEVMFYEKENWTVRVRRNGIGPGSRGPEKLIRIVNIG